MGDKESAVQLDSYEENLDFDELERKLEEELQENVSDLELLSEDKAKISNPDNIGKAVMDVVWEQFIIQVGAVAGEDFIKENGGLKLDLRDEAHIQTTENFEKGKIASHNTEMDYQERYEDWQANFVKDENGNVVTHKTRSGREEPTLIRGARSRFDIGRPKGSIEKHTDMDHTVSAGEIIRDPAANAHMTKQEQEAFANDPVNLFEMDSSLNRSKGDTPTTEWLENPNANGQKPKEIFDNLDEEKLRQQDKRARKEFDKRKMEAEKRSIDAGRKSQKKEAFRIGGKALRAAVMVLLAELIRNIIGKLIMWLKSQEKNLQTLANRIKEAVATFLNNIEQNLLAAGTVASATLLSAILGPIVSTIQKIWMLIKKGGNSVKEAINYINSPENREKSFGILMLEVSKIVMTGLTGMSALLLGEVIEKELIVFPVFAVEIPFMGSLASILGIFFGAVTSGIAGALVLNLIDKIIANKKKREITKKQIEKGNEVLAKQKLLRKLDEEKLQATKDKTVLSIKARHGIVSEMIKESLVNIFDNSNIEETRNEARKKKIFDTLDDI